MKKIAYLIVNKSASIKAIGKEIFKLNAIISNTRVGGMVDNYNKLILKLSKDQPVTNTNLLSEMSETLSENTLTNKDFDLWTETPSKESYGTDGQLRDECELAWPLSYHEFEQKEFDQKTTKIIDSLNQGKNLFKYKNVLLSLPINLNGNTDYRINEILTE